MSRGARIAAGAAGVIGVRAPAGEKGVLRVLGLGLAHVHADQEAPADENDREHNPADNHKYPIH